MKYLTKFSHTGLLEILHALYNKWTPKSQHFSHLGMVTRSQLAVMDFNSGSNLPQARTKSAQGKYSLGYSKIRKQWSNKPIKLQKDKTHYSEIIDRTAEVIKNKIQLPLPKSPKNLPKKLLQLRARIKKLSSKHKNQGFQSEVTPIKTLLQVYIYYVIVFKCYILYMHLINLFHLL